jgi:transcriptional repressor NrdR
MRCPFCDAEKDSLKVIDSRSCDAGKSIRRRRECLQCGKRFTTYERVESTMRLAVIKKDGRRVPWDRNKILAGLERACFKRPVPEGELQRIVDEVEEETFKSHDREAPTSFVGRLVADKLRRLDQVAYVRFASVYRQFKTLEELVDEAKAVLDARRYDDPDQGKLFLDDAAAAQTAAAAAAAAAATQANGQDKGEESEVPKVRPARRRHPGKTGAPATDKVSQPPEIPEPAASRSV